MPTNQFLVWAATINANSYTYAQYLALTARTAGVVPGVADGLAANAAWRQTSVMAAMIGQFIVDRVSQDTVDDGTTTALLAQFKAAIQTYGRIRLTSNLIIYVSPSGSDSNTGLTVGSPFLTLQKAWNYLSQNYDLAGFVATIQLANGTYTTGMQAAGPIIGAYGAAAVVVQGNTGTPASVVVSVTSSNCFIAQEGAVFTVTGVTMAATGSGQTGNALLVATNGEIFVGVSCVFSTCSAAHMLVEADGSLQVLANYTISGNAPVHWNVNAGAVSMVGFTATLTGTPAFATAFAVVQVLGQIQLTGVTFSGAATGTRYTVTGNSVLFTNGSGTSFLPGNSAGSTATGGQYL